MGRDPLDNLTFINEMKKRGVIVPQTKDDIGFIPSGASSIPAISQDIQDTLAGWKRPVKIHLINQGTASSRLMCNFCTDATPIYQAAKRVFKVFSHRIREVYKELKRSPYPEDSEIQVHAACFNLKCYLKLRKWSSE